MKCSCYKVAYHERVLALYLIGHHSALTNDVAFQQKWS